MILFTCCSVVENSAYVAATNVPIFCEIEKAITHMISATIDERIRASDDHDRALLCLYRLQSSSASRVTAAHARVFHLQPVRRAPNPTFVAVCHCLDCKKSSGGEAATFFGVRRQRPPHGRRTGTTGEWPPAARRSPPAPAKDGPGRGPPPRGRVRSRCTTRGGRTRPRTRRRRRTSAGRRRTPGGPRCARGCGRRCDGRPPPAPPRTPPRTAAA